MPKFQSTKNPNQIIEVSEERATILRTPVQDGWKEYFEEVPKQEPIEQKKPTRKPGRPKKVE